MFILDFEPLALQTKCPTLFSAPILNIHQTMEWNTLSSICYRNKFCFAEKQGKKKKKKKRKKEGQRKKQNKNDKIGPFYIRGKKPWTNLKILFTFWQRKHHCKITYWALPQIYSKGRVWSLHSWITLSFLYHFFASQSGNALKTNGSKENKDLYYTSFHEHLHCRNPGRTLRKKTV